MRRAIREHLRDFVAIFVLLATAIVTTGIILALPDDPAPLLGPVHRGRQVRAQGRVQLGPGGDAGAGTDGDDRRDQRRPGVRVGARQRSRHRHHAGRPQVRRAHPSGRLASAAAPDGAPGHDDRGRPRRRRRAGRGGHDAAARQLAAERPAGPDLRLAGRRHPLLPPAPARGGRQGPRGRQRAQARGWPEALLPLRARPRQDQRSPRRAAEEHRAGDHELRAPEPGARPPRYPPRRVRHLLERCPGLVRARGGLAPRAAARAAGSPRRDSRGPGKRRSLRKGPRAWVAAVDPRRAGAWAGAGTGAAALPQHGRPDPRPDPSLRARRAEAAEATQAAR